MYSVLVRVWVLGVGLGAHVRMRVRVWEAEYVGERVWECVCECVRDGLLESPSALLRVPTEIPG